MTYNMTMSEEFEVWAETHALSEEVRGYGMVKGAWQDAWQAATERRTNLKDPMKTLTKTNTVAISALPKLGEDLEGGTFSGLTTKPDGTHCAVILLPDAATKLTWQKAKAWATKQDSELPSRPVAAMLFANVKARLTPAWHWTSEEEDASYAWSCFFDDGCQYLTHESYEGPAVAVRLIPVTA